jgi:hypothetical protein
MKRLLVLLTVVAWSGSPAASTETEQGMSLASLEYTAISSNVNQSSDRSPFEIKEGESDPPEVVERIERNREDRERTVVIDR